MQLTPSSVLHHRQRRSRSWTARTTDPSDATTAAAPRDDGWSAPIAVGGPELMEALAHELRTPMTTIYGGAQVLARHERLSSATRDEGVNAVAEEAERLGRLVDDLRVVADVQARTPLPRDPVLMQRVATKVIREMVEGKPGARIRSVLPTETPRVTGDPGAWQPGGIGCHEGADRGDGRTLMGAAAAWWRCGVRTRVADPPGRHAAQLTFPGDAAASTPGRTKVRPS